MKRNKGQYCGAMVALAVQSPQPQRVLSRLIAERAFLWIIMIVQESITMRPRRETASSEAQLHKHTLTVRIRPTLSFLLKEG